MNAPMNRYATFLNESQKDFKLILFCAASLLVYRIILINRFYIYFSEPLEIIDYLMALFVGFRFDISIGAYVALFPFFMSIFCLYRPIAYLSQFSRYCMLIFFSALNVVIMLANYLFFLEYEDNFNQWIFGALYDDFSAVLSTVWKSFPLFSISCFLLSATIISIYLGLYFIKHPFYCIKDQQSEYRTITKVTWIFCIMLLFFVALRGSMNTRPVQLKDAGVTCDRMLNKMIINPYYALIYVVKRFRKLSHSDGLDLYVKDKNIQKACVRYFGKTSSNRNIDHFMKKKARGILQKQPRHIFLFIMESFDAWPLSNEYKSFDLLPGIRKLSKKGILLTHFLSSGTGTMTSFSSIVTGLPDAGVITNYQDSARKLFPTSLTSHFKRLGYTCNMYYGGYLSWQRIGDFCKDQGFDHIVGGGHMGRWPLKEWGVDDEQLFDYILKKFNYSEPSLNVILSTSNHPPYDIPVYQMGFPYKKIPEDLKNVYDNSWPLATFGHLWYSDKMLCEFIDRISQKEPDSLFFITGDHWSRKFLNARPNLLIRSTVPLLIYRRKGLALTMDASSVAASHLNILPTMIECCASKGFEYYSICQDIFNNKRIPFGIGRKCLITPCQLFNIDGDHYQFSQKCDKLLFSSEQAKQHIKDMYGIGWWRIMKGANF